MVDISELKQNIRTYAGMSCIKIGVTMDGVNYLVKYPGNLRDRNLTNVSLSYSNGPVCEYLGSHIFSLFGMDAHETKLALRNGKIVVMCQDFVPQGARVLEFRELKATYEPAFISLDGNVSDGTGSDLDEALLVIRNHPIAKGLSRMEERFWKMFVVDAFIGNSDRNNGNWGVLTDGISILGYAPIYDNGCCLNEKWDDTKMKRFLKDSNVFLNEAWKGKVCFFTKGKKRLNPFQVIESGKYEKCTEAIKWLVSQDFSQVYQLIETCDILTEVQETFYLKLLREREKHLKEIVSKLETTKELSCF